MNNIYIIKVGLSSLVEASCQRSGGQMTEGVVTLASAAISLLAIGLLAFTLQLEM